MAEFITPRHAEVGGVAVRRLLPRATRRTVGAWCFVDLAGPLDAAGTSMQVGPHPHIGLHTVTWMLAGEVVHRDSLGNEQVLRPGQLNLMTAGRGIAHAEQSPARTSGMQHLVQLWVAQPDAERNGEPAFAHHAELPRVQIGGALATVLVGEFAGTTSPARADTPLVGVELVVHGTVDIPLAVGFEHAVLALDAPVQVDDAIMQAATLAYLAPGIDHVRIAADDARIMLLGGRPFTERLAMHWNFVARTADELVRAIDEWNDNSERFGTVGGGLPRIPAPPMLTA